jgi:hypothetical protein
MRIVGVLLASATALIGATACSEAVANQAGVWVTVTPASVPPGGSVAIRASCVDNSKAASVMSIAFGTVTVQPVNGLLSAQALVPPAKEKGNYDVRLSCPSGSQANSTITVVNGTAAPTTAAATLGPHTGGGFLANGRPGEPADRGPLVWLGIGLSSLIAAAVVTVRSKLRKLHREPAPTGRR